MSSSSGLPRSLTGTTSLFMMSDTHETHFPIAQITHLRGEERSLGAKMKESGFRGDVIPFFQYVHQILIHILIIANTIHSHNSDSNNKIQVVGRSSHSRLC